jgi:carbamoyl-phosphate synthase large subunit
MSDPVRVFFTGGGGAGTIEVIKALRALGGYEIIAADASPSAAGYAFADRGYVVPFGSDERFVPALRRILAEEKPHFVVPLVDEEIPKVHRLVREEFEGVVRVLAPKLEFCELVLDKWTMALALQELGLPVAKSWLASDASEATYPAIVKPRQGRGSRGLAFLEGPHDLELYLDAAPEPADAYLVQDRLMGREFTTSVVVGLDGTLLAVVPKEATDKRGITQVGVTRRVQAIDDLGAALTRKLDPRGPFNVQLTLGRDGVPRVFEINPRYSTTVALTLAAGVNEVDAVLRHALGKDPGSLSFEPDLMMVRYTTQTYLKEESWAPIDLREPGPV